MKLNRRFVPLGLAAIFFSSVSSAADVSKNPWYQAGQQAVAQAQQEIPINGYARNVILFIGDGMGIPTVTSARILAGQLEGNTGEENVLSFERFPWMALSKTYNTNQQVPDSAGTMTAMVTGVKTRAGVLSLDENARRQDASAVAATSVPTLFEQASARGLATGLVTTTRVTHATPAALYAHSPERDWESDAKLPKAAQDAGFPDIALQMMEFPSGGIDVVLGGGRRVFVPDDQNGNRRDGRNLITEWQGRHPDGGLPRTRADLLAIKAGKTSHVLGLFSPSHMDFEVDRVAAGKKQPSLAEMTGFAIDSLSQNKKGYVLMVEGGRIDHAHHMNNAHRALVDTIAMAEAVQTAVDKTSASETLIVVTADHGHVITLGGFPTRGNPILGLVVDNDSYGEPKSTPSKDLTGKPFTSLSYANGPGYHGASESQPEGAKTFPHGQHTAEGTRRGRADLSNVDTESPNYLQETTVPLAYESHSGEDVPVYAEGPGASLFRGVVEQNYLYHAIREALGWNRTAPATNKSPNPPPKIPKQNS